VCDATVRGGLACYINHSCSPNCYTKIFREDGANKIGIFSLAQVDKGQELLYDYKVGPSAGLAAGWRRLLARRLRVSGQVQDLQAPHCNCCAPG
jgi:hypothetical protein